MWMKPVVQTPSPRLTSIWPVLPWDYWHSVHLAKPTCCTASNTRSIQQKDMQIWQMCTQSHFIKKEMVKKMMASQNLEHPEMFTV